MLAEPISDALGDGRPKRRKLHGQTYETARAVTVGVGAGMPLCAQPAWGAMATTSTVPQPVVSPPQRPGFAGRARPTHAPHTVPCGTNNGTTAAAQCHTKYNKYRGAALVSALRADHALHAQ